MYTCAPVFEEFTINDQNSGQALSLSTSNPVLDTVAITASGTYGIDMSSSSRSSPAVALSIRTVTDMVSTEGSPIISNYNISIVNMATNTELPLPPAQHHHCQ